MQVDKQKAHRDHIKSKKAKKRKMLEAATTPSTDVAEESLDIITVEFPFAADSGDDEHCRLCGFTVKRSAVKCNGCSGMICYKCSQLKRGEFKSEKLSWICEACDMILKKM